MKVENIVRFALACLVAGSVVVPVARVGGLSRAETAAAKPAAAKAASYKLIACYFHRTKRCPTCMKISAYSEEAIKTGFAKAIKEGQIEWRMVDFQKPENRKYVDYYKITQPTLLLLEVRDNKVTRWKDLTQVWDLVHSKPEFVKYVQTETRGLIEEKRK
ncbi:MAG: nitrophenyl compound nitroreductase subunit ArsF family protein [Pirellulales bacterium]